MEEEYVDDDGSFWYENDSLSDAGNVLLAQLSELFPKAHNYNDLQLAAELGKTLLERNKDLEAQLRLAQHTQLEHQKEIELLSKQLEVLRNVNESRMKIYEEVDRSLQETERANERLVADSKIDKDRIKSLSEAVESLEVRNDELSARLEQEKAERARASKRREKRTWSVPSLPDALAHDQRGFGCDEFQGFPAADDLWSKRAQRDDKEIKDLRDTVKILKLQLTTGHKRQEELSEANERLVEEGKIMRERIEDFERFQEERRNDSFHQELLQQQKEEEGDGTDRLCQDCGTRLKLAAMVKHAELLEHDGGPETLPRGQLMRLKNGGSAYGSRESLNQMGLEPVTPSVESCGEILAAAAREAAAEIDNLSRNYDTDLLPPKRKEVSLLGELEEQYRSLVKKYENLIEAKTHRRLAKEAFTQDNLDIATIATPRDPKGRPTSLFMPRESPPTAPNPQWRRSACFDLKSPVDPTVGHFENGPPEYKKLFQEIFETLKRSVSYAEGLNVEADDQGAAAN